MARVCNDLSLCQQYEVPEFCTYFKIFDLEIRIHLNITVEELDLENNLIADVNGFNHIRFTISFAGITE